MFLSAAAWTSLADNTCVSAARVTVNRVVDSAIAYSRLLHAAYDLFKSTKIFKRITVKLDIADVTCVCKLMVRSFDLDLFKCTYGIVNRYVERVCIVFTVCNALDDTILLSVHTYKTT